MYVPNSQCMLFNCVSESVFMFTVAGFSIIGGFGMTLAMAKKKDPTMFTKVTLYIHILLLLLLPCNELGLEDVL